MGERVGKAVGGRPNGFREIGDHTQNGGEILNSERDGDVVTEKKLRLWTKKTTSGEGGGANELQREEGKIVFLKRRGGGNKKLGKHPHRGKECS